MPSFSRGRVVALDVPVEVVVLLRLVVAVGALLPLNADVVPSPSRKPVPYTSTTSTTTAKANGVRGDWVRVDGSR